MIAVKNRIRTVNDCFNIWNTTLRTLPAYFCFGSWIFWVLGNGVLRRPAVFYTFRSRNIYLSRSGRAGNVTRRAVLRFDDFLATCSWRPSVVRRNSSRDKTSGDRAACSPRGDGSLSKSKFRPLTFHVDDDNDKPYRIRSERPSRTLHIKDRPTNAERSDNSDFPQRVINHRATRIDPVRRKLRSFISARGKVIIARIRLGRVSDSHVAHGPENSVSV